MVGPNSRRAHGQDAMPTTRGGKEVCSSSPSDLGVDGTCGALIGIVADEVGNADVQVIHVGFLGSRPVVCSPGERFSVVHISQDDMAYACASPCMA